MKEIIAGVRKRKGDRLENKGLFGYDHGSWVYEEYTIVLN